MDRRDTDTLRAWVDVDLGALVANYETLQAWAKPRAGMMPVVKADAYGLGVGPVVMALESCEPWGYVVAAASEAVEVRGLGIDRPILSITSTPDELDLVAEAGATPAIGDLETLERWRAIGRRLARRLPFHLEVDSGMGRSGFRDDAVASWLPCVVEAVEGDLHWQGTFTHYHSADEPEAGPTEGQWKRFQRCLNEFPEGVGGLIHSTASVAVARWPEYADDLVRPGIFLYGGIGGNEPFLPKPVAAVRARVATIREVPKGWTVGYGSTYRASRAERWATLAIGYGDGLRREVANVGAVRFGKREAPIIGRISMDMTVVDVTDIEGVDPGSIATVIGGPHDASTSLIAVAETCGTISYEILTGLTRRLPRRYAQSEP